MTLLIEKPHKVSADELIARLYRTEKKAEIVNGEIASTRRRAFQTSCQSDFHQGIPYRTLERVANGP